MKLTRAAIAQCGDLEPVVQSFSRFWVIGAADMIATRKDTRAIVGVRMIPSRSSCAGVHALML